MSDQPVREQNRFVQGAGWLLTGTLLGMLLSYIFGTVTEGRTTFDRAEARFAMEVAWNSLSFGTAGFLTMLLLQVSSSRGRFRLRWFIELIVCVSILAFFLHHYLDASYRYQDATERMIEEAERMNKEIQALYSQGQNSAK